MDDVTKAASLRQRVLLPNALKSSYSVGQGTINMGFKQYDVVQIPIGSYFRRLIEKILISSKTITKICGDGVNDALFLLHRGQGEWSWVQRVCSLKPSPGLEICAIIVITWTHNASESYRRKTTEGKFEMILGGLIRFTKAAKSTFLSPSATHTSNYSVEKFPYSPN